MISLKRCIEADREEALRAAVESYRNALGAVADGGTLACPAAGSHLRESLWSLQEHLSADATPARIRETGERAREEIRNWVEQAGGYFRQRAAEFKEMLIAMARTADAVGERDQRYTSQLSRFTARLEAAANLEDLTRMRASLVEGASDLKACVDRMAQDSLETVEGLRGELRNYQARLEAAERLASRDPLTGLDNRRRIEEWLQFRTARGLPFAILLVDLNGFKQVNDRYGHLAGDEVLKQFAGELKSAFRATDAVGRWGGDEFIAVLECGLEQAQLQVERVRQWTCGDYTVQAGGGRAKVHVGAAIGAAEWKTGEPVADTLARADGEMYRQKPGAQPSG